LNLGNNQISDIFHLKNLVNLETLWLHNNQISDISPLIKLTNLEWIDLRGDFFIENQINKLKEILPNCKIDF
jgi:Leucine-rich repeat (LRR) protein